MKKHVNEERIISTCSACNGACCKIFALDYSKKDFFNMLIGKMKQPWKSKHTKLALIKNILWLKDISNTPEGILCKKDRNYKYIFSCKKLSKDGKCKVYKRRLEFCYNYDCYGDEQLAHQILQWPRKNIIIKELIVTPDELLIVKDVALKDCESLEN